jgi:outer membrane protein OmpA-like peptidoglycan-associated protein
VKHHSDLFVLRTLLVITSLLLFAFSNHASSEKHVLKFYFLVNQFKIDDSELEKAIANDGLTLESVRRIVTEVHITGFTDCSGSNSYNLVLSERRANAVATHWKNITGIAPLTIKGTGESGCDPLETEYDGSLRRVEIEFEITKPPAISNIQNDFTAASTASVGDILPITGLNFFGGKHFPLVKSYEVLDELVGIMNDNPTLVIEIQGHVCCGKIPTADGTDLDTGEPRLSENRAKFVYEHLIKNGIAPERMSYKGFAQTRPLPITLEDPGLESLNRRVEIMIVSN